MNLKQFISPKKHAIALLITTLLFAGGAIAQSFPTLQARLKFPSGRDQFSA